MHRLLVTTNQLMCDAPVLSKEARKHLKVIRPKDGEGLELLDGVGRTRRVVYRAATGALQPCAESVQSPPPPPLILFACVTKTSRWDWTIEKATELGVTRIIPVLSARSVVRIGADERVAKSERWRRIAEEAARQSDACWLPEILAPVTFAEALPLVRETHCLIGALTTPPAPMIATALSDLRAPLALFVGPEGDFTPDELAALSACATPVSFGSTILRAETAAIYGLSVLKAAQDAHVSAR